MPPARRAGWGRSWRPWVGTRQMLPCICRALLHVASRNVLEALCDAALHPVRRGTSLKHARASGGVRRGQGSGRAAERAGAVAPRAPAFGDRGLDPCSRREVGEAPAGGLSARARLHALEPLGPETDRDSLTKGCEGGAPPPQTRRGSADCAARFGRCRAEKSVRGWGFGRGKIMAQCTMASPYEATKGAQNETHVVVPGQYVERRRLASFA